MTWALNLLPASFRGVEFDILSTDDEADRALARHAYPYRDGEDIEDMGRRARRISIKAIFYGDDYESRLQAFIEALDEADSGTLVHPVFGVMDDVQAAGYKIHHDAETIDSCTISIEFEESTTAQPFFSRQLASQKADAIGLSALAASAASGNVLAAAFGALAALNTLGALSRIAALRACTVGFLLALNAVARGVVSSITNPVRMGVAFVADVAALTNALINVVPDELDRLHHYAQSTMRQIDSLLTVGVSTYGAAVTYPVSTAQLLADQQVLTAHVAVERASANAQLVGLVLASESIDPTMTPQQIESLINAVRRAINEAVDAVRARYGVEECRAITEPLKTLALNVQEAGRSVILARPPMVARKVDAPTPLRLLAHVWYGDHARSAEILRLNNLRVPNTISAGEVLNVYSR
jgi:prophage DNA circulation protein